MKRSWKAAFGLAAVLALAVVPAPAMATTHTTTPICAGTGAPFRACVNDMLATQAHQIAALKQRVHVLEHKVGWLTEKQFVTFGKIHDLQTAVAALQAADVSQNADIKKLNDTYACQFGNLLNVTTTLVTNTDGFNVEALILNHHALTPNYALVFNGCHS